MVRFASVLAGWILWRAVLPLRIRWCWKILLALGVLIFSFKFQLLRYFGGKNYFAPEVPGWILPVSAWFFAILFFFFFLLSAAEIVRGIGWLIRKIRHGKRPQEGLKLRNRINLILFVLSVVLASFSVGNALAFPSVRKVTVWGDNLPPEAENLRMVLLTDLHIDIYTGEERIRAITRTVNDLKPDLILLDGDLVDGSVARREKDFQPFRDLKAKYGVYAAPGNHEYYSGFAEWMEFFPTLGIHMLLNEGVLLPCGVFLAGVTDPAARHRREKGPDLEEALRDAPAAAPVILLSHRPNLAPEAAAHGVALQLSGHTHGGMIPIFGQVVKSINGGFLSGFYSVGRMTLYVSNGSGIWTGFPFRLWCDSEITLLEWKRRK